jgi:hypothetical protein
MTMPDKPFLLARSVAAAQGMPGQPETTFRALADALQALVGHKVMTVLKLDERALRSIRLFSSEPSYPPGGVKQHQPGVWSEAIVGRKTYFIAPTMDDVRLAFFDYGGIAAAGCGSVLCLPVLYDGHCLATLNLWHASGHYDRAAAELALPFAGFLIPSCRD